MSPLRCELLCSSSRVHLEQIYAGFGLLARRGLLSLTMRRRPGYRGTYAGVFHLAAVLRGGGLPREGLRVAFDLADEAEFPEDLLGADVYFKRSYRPGLVGRLGLAGRVFPLGLNYLVYARGSGGLRRSLWALDPVEVAASLVRQSFVLSSLWGAGSSAGTCSVRRLERLPRLDREPRILFMTRLWELDGSEDRAEVNRTRVETIRALRRAFPRLFLGGVSHTPLAAATCPDCLIPDKRLAHKKSYLRVMHESSIGVTTTGLNGSTGFKFAEYLAAAKAVVSEPLLNAVPGDLSAGRNYEEFRSPGECVERVGRLVESASARLEMMRANLAYYHAYVRPDALVWNAVTTALASGVTPAPGPVPLRPAAA